MDLSYQHFTLSCAPCHSACLQIIADKMHAKIAKCGGSYPFHLSEADNMMSTLYVMLCCSSFFLTALGSPALVFLVKIHGKLFK